MSDVRTAFTEGASVDEPEELTQLEASSGGSASGIDITGGIDITTGIDISAQGRKSSETEAPASYNIILSFAMMFLFAAYLGMQNYLTSVVGQPGYDALAIIFAIFGIGNLFASASIGILGQRLALIIGAWSHLAIVFAAAMAVTDKSYVWMLYPGACICGIGASFLWAAHGAYVAGLVPNHKLGDAFGVFWSIFGFNEIFGFGLILILNLTAGDSDEPAMVLNVTSAAVEDDACGSGCQSRAKLFLWVLVGVAIFACCLFFFVRPWPAKATAQKSAAKTNEAPSVMEPVVQTLRLFVNFRVMLLLPTAVLCGYLEGFYFASFPTYMDDRVIIPTSFILHGLAVMVCSPIIGKMADKYGIVPVHALLMLTTIVGAACAYVAMVNDAPDVEYRNALFFLAVTLGFGIVDFPMQGLLRKMISILLEEDGLVNAGMGWLMFAVALGLTVAIQGGQFFSPLMHSLILTGLAVVSAVAVQWMPKYVVAGTENQLQESDTPVKALKAADLEVAIEGKV